MRQLKFAMLAASSLVALTSYSCLNNDPASAADLLARPIYRAPVAAVAFPSWTGFYIGGNVGGSIGILNPTDTLTTGAVSVTNTDRRALPGAIGGVQVGYNWQAGLWLLGVEGDWQWSNEEATATSLRQITALPITVTASDQERIRDLATARGRLGYVHGDYLWFVTGGAAWSRIESNYALAITTPIAALARSAAANFDTTKSGWTVGGGVETLLGGNWSAKLEYLYVDLGNVTNVFGTTSTFTANESVNEHVIRVGINYRFGYYPALTR